MKKLIVLLTVLMIGNLIHAQIITVKDKETGEPIEKVAFLTYKPNHLAATNHSGQIDLSPFEGAEHIEIMMYGYKKVITSYEQLASKEELFLESLTFSSDAVIVSANRWNQNLNEIPAKVTPMTREDILLQNPQTAADMLGQSGGVYIQKSQMGGGSPMIRGFATNRLLYSVDGVRMNTAIFRGGNLQNVISLDPFALEEAEILFGPGSVMYGSDAIGAVMSFETLKPEFSLDDETFVTGSAVTRYGSASNEKTVHFDVNVGWKKWAMLTSFSSFNFGDLKMGSYGPSEYLRPYYIQRQDSTDIMVTNEDPRVQRPTGYEQINFMQKLRYAPNDKWDLTYAFHYSETSPYSRYDRHIRYKDGLPRYGEWYYGPQIWMMNQLSISHQGDNALYDRMSIRFAQQKFEESRISRDFNDDNRERRIENVDAYSVNVDFNKSLSSRNTLYYGFEGVLNDVKSTGLDEDISTGAVSPGASRYPQSQWTSYGAYLTNHFRINQKIALQAGVRYSVYQLEAKFDTSFYPFPYTEAQMNNGALTGSIGAVYRPEESLVIQVNASTGFRSPNVDDMGKVFDSEPGNVVVPNPDLNAEYAYNVDIGFSKYFGNVLKLDATGYYTILQNALVRRDFTLNGMDSILYDGEMSKVQAIQNAAVANVWGIQTGLEINFTHGFTLKSDFNYQIGEEELDDGTISPSRHAAPWFGITRLQYKNKKGLQLQVYAEYSGGKSFDELPDSEKDKAYIYAIDSNGNPYSPSWATLNFKGMYQFTPNFAVSAGLENITDVRYKTYSSGIAAPGRNVILSLKANF